MGDVAADETFNGTFPFKAHYSDAPGFRMHYVDEGAGEPILCSHGFPTWGYLWRKLIAPLSEHHRVIVPDHIGFGKSSAPEGAPPGLHRYVLALEALILELDLRDITLVGHDIGGAICSGFARRHPDRIKRIIMMDTVFVGMSGDAEVKALSRNYPEAPYTSWLLKLHEQDRLMDVMSSMDVTVLQLLKMGTSCASLDRDMLEAYAAPFQGEKARSSATAGAMRHLVRAEALSGDREMLSREELSGEAEQSIWDYDDEEAVEQLKSKPAIYFIGEDDFALRPQHMIPLFRNGWPEAPVVRVRNAGHFIQEDVPELLVARIEEFIEATGG